MILNIHVHKYFYFLNFYFFESFLKFVFGIQKVGAGGKSGARVDENHECYFLASKRHDFRNILQPTRSLYNF